MYDTRYHNISRVTMHGSPYDCIAGNVFFRASHLGISMYNGLPRAMIIILV